MLTLLLHSKTSWKDYFPGTSPTNYNSQLFTSRQTPSFTYLHISKWLFRSITSSSSSGGALYCSNSVTFLFVESSSFFSCKTSSSQGGAIYFYNTGSGQCVLYEVCGYDCCSTYSSSISYGQFAYIYVNDGVSSKNYVNYSSIVRCVIATSNQRCLLYLYNGKIYCPSVNVSMNKCKHFTGIYCVPYVDSNSVTGSISYSSLVDNNPSSSIIISFDRSSPKYEIKSCNIIRNIQGAPANDGLIRMYGNTVIENSCVLENTANYIFLTYSSSTTTLSNCTVDSTSNNGCLTIRNTVTKSFILALNHMSTKNCHSEYDSAGYLTPIIQTPSPSKKQKIYYSCEQRNFVPLTNVLILIFNFIYPYDFGNHW
jgi:hypothetical protein